MGFRRIVTRPDFMRPPDLPLPFHARSAGHYLLDMDYVRGSSGNEGFVEVLWGIAGAGEMEIAGESLRLGAGDVVWKLCGEPHGYRPLSPDWELRWFTFDGPSADSFVRSYGYPRQLEGAGPCPTELFLELESGLREMSPYSQRRMVSVVAALLALAGRRLGAKGEACRVCDRFVELAQAKYPDKNVNVNTLSELLGLHRSTLSRHFQEVMRMTPGEYLGRLRIQEALALLEGTDLPVSEIAARVGMPNRSHFSRALRKAGGASPVELRSRYRALGGD